MAVGGRWILLPTPGSPQPPRPTSDNLFILSLAPCSDTRGNLVRLLHRSARRLVATCEGYSSSFDVFALSCYPWILPLALPFIINSYNYLQNGGQDCIRNFSSSSSSSSMGNSACPRAAFCPRHRRKQVHFPIKHSATLHLKHCELTSRPL